MQFCRLLIDVLFVKINVGIDHISQQLRLRMFLQSMWIRQASLAQAVRCFKVKTDPVKEGVFSAGDAVKHTD